MVHQECTNPDAQLASLMQPLEALREKGCVASANGRSECDRLRVDIERLALVCPGHAPTLMANAVFAYEEHRPIKAQQYLDELLSQPGSHADAAALRARIAVEEGNLNFARRLLTTQIRMAPNHAGLHETLGAALYLAGQLDEAARELGAASALGAPRWRIAYHLGLIEEAAGRVTNALSYYNESNAAHPGWPPVEARIRALSKN